MLPSLCPRLGFLLVVPSLGPLLANAIKQHATRGSVLDVLQRLATKVAGTYGWEVIGTLLFILTGAPAEVSAPRATTEKWPRFEATARITLTIDPALSPDVVRDFYKHVREDVLGRRYRSLSKKHLEMARFIVPWPPVSPWADWLNEERAKLPWAEKLQLWNRTYPQWEYDLRYESNFRRDCLKAKQRLLHSA